MNSHEFLIKCSDKGYKEKDLFKFEEALDIARIKLEDKKRIAGDSFFDHNMRVGKILADHNLAPEVVLAGLLHGIKDVNEEIKKNIGNEVLKLLQGVDEIDTIKLRNPQLAAEVLRKIILTTLHDVRVIFVKLANKIDNLRSINVLSNLDQQRIAKEVLEIYAPLAYRLGMDKVKTQLEDLSFKVLEPKKYLEIENSLEESSEQRDRNAAHTITLIKSISKGQIEINKITARSKHIYSIYKKMQYKGIPLQELYDLLGIRIIVPEIKDCYTLLGLLHENFDPIPGRLKDYISNPKPNFYRSLHTGVKLLGGTRAEIQIRTEEMDEFAEEGMAAHWHYKGVKSDQFFEKKISWLRGIIDLQNDVEHKELLETLKVDVFGDEIHCYTPKGDVKELPKGSTILDFAYLVHEEIGSRCVGGRVNGKFVPIKHELQLGDVVEVVTNKNQRPRRSWIKIVKSARARQKIRKSLKQHEKLAPFYYRLLKTPVKEEQGVLVKSLEFPKAVCILAKCCYALPGNEIIGIVTKRKIISVHRKDCRSALKEEQRWVQVNWKEVFNQRINFSIEAEERSGLLADLLHTIATTGFEVKEAKAKLIDLGHAECSFNVVPRDLEELKGLIQRIEKVKSVNKIYFE